MTIASAIDDVIIDQGGTPDPTDTIADSLVNLAGVLAGETIDKTETIEGAVKILGEHIGGGGGASVGNITYLFYSSDAAPEVGEFDWDIYGMLQTYDLKIGNAPLANGQIPTTNVAAGVTLDFQINNGYSCEFYDCAVTLDGGSLATITSVTEITLTYTTRTEDDVVYVTITVPDLGANHALCVNCITANS